MRLIIDTEKNVIICPKPFFSKVQKKNDILKSVGKEPVTHHQEVKDYFDKAIQNELVRSQDVKKK